MNARDPHLPLQADEAAALGDFAARVWDEEIVPALTDYIAIPAKSPMFDADWAANGHIEKVLTQAAAARVRAIADKQGKPAVLRLAVEGGGCSGFQYRFALADSVEADDRVSETGGVRLAVDPVSLDLVAGYIVDFVESLGGAALRVDNPQAVAGCGCGSSFGI